MMFGYDTGKSSGRICIETAEAEMDAYERNREGRHARGHLYAAAANLNASIRSGGLSPRQVDTHFTRLRMLWAESTQRY